MAFTNAYPDLWHGAKEYFKLPNGNPAPFAFNCRLMFYIYGNWTVPELYETPITKSLSRAHQVLYSSHPDYILDAKRGPMQRALKDLIDSIDDYNQETEQTSTLQHLLTTAAAINHAGMTPKRQAVKAKGFMFPVNHIDGTNELSDINALFNTDNFLGAFARFNFHELLTKSFRSLSQSQKSAITKAKRLGVVQTAYNRFTGSETPHSLYDVSEGEMLTADNDRCCGGDDHCQPYNGQGPSYCEHAEDGYCGIMSDTCPS